MLRGPDIHKQPVVQAHNKSSTGCVTPDSLHASARAGGRCCALLAAWRACAAWGAWGASRLHVHGSRRLSLSVVGAGAAAQGSKVLAISTALLCLHALLDTVCTTRRHGDARHGAARPDTAALLRQPREHVGREQGTEDEASAGAGAAGEGGDGDGDGGSPAKKPLKKAILSYPSAAKAAPKARRALSACLRSRWQAQAAAPSASAPGGAWFSAAARLVCTPWHGAAPHRDHAECGRRLDRRWAKERHPKCVRWPAVTLHARCGPCARQAAAPSQEAARPLDARVPVARRPPVAGAG